MQFRDPRVLAVNTFQINYVCLFFLVIFAYYDEFAYYEYSC